MTCVKRLQSAAVDGIIPTIFASFTAGGKFNKTSLSKLLPVNFPNDEVMDAPVPVALTHLV